jgi:hypothetical protein
VSIHLESSELKPIDDSPESPELEIMSSNKNVNLDNMTVYTADSYSSSGGPKRKQACKFCHEGRWAVCSLTLNLTRMLSRTNIFSSALARVKDMNVRSVGWQVKPV